MSEQQISINLRMVTVPESPMRHYAAPAAAKRLPAFNLGRLLNQLLLMVLVAALSLGCYLGISHYLVQSIEVVGQSMLPTLQPGNHYILNRWAYHKGTPQRGDVVVIRDPADHGFSVKRIVAVGGESVHFLGGKVYINGEMLKEPYLAPGTYTFTYSHAQEQFLSCGKDQYFVMGDNRSDSIDSRAYGTVQQSDVLGRVMLQ